MKLIRASAIATSMLAAQGAHASSFIVLAPIEPGDAVSVVYRGEPPAVTATPDRSIRTAAFGQTGDLAGGETSAARGPAPEPRHAAIWPPRATRSIILFGTPLPETPATERPVLRAAAPVSPMVIRGGLVGDAFPVLSDPGPADDFAPPAAGPAPAMGEEEGERHLTRRQQRREERREAAEPAPTVELPPPAAPTGLPM